MTSFNFYNLKADNFFAQYQALSFEQVHSDWLDLLPAKAGLALPELGKVRALSQTFDLIVLSAVWMHLPESQRERAFRVLSNLLAPSGLLVMSLRHGSNTDEREFHAVSVA